MRAYILMDRSGSMGSLGSEPVNSVNAYVAKLPVKTKVRLDTFDTGSMGMFHSNSDWYTTVRNTTAGEFTPVTLDEVSPRGSTPLNDAAGKLLTEVLQLKDKKVVVVIMTDGHENMSREFTVAQVKDLIKRVEEKGYEVIMLGADFKDVESQAAQYGLLGTKTMNMSKGNITRSMEGLANMSVAYMSGAARGIELDATTKANAQN